MTNPPPPEWEAHKPPSSDLEETGQYPPPGGFPPPSDAPPSVFPPPGGVSPGGGAYPTSFEYPPIPGQSTPGGVLPGAGGYPPPPGAGGYPPPPGAGGYPPPPGAGGYPPVDYPPAAGGYPPPYGAYPAPPPYGAYPQPRGSSGLAIGSLVCSLVGLLCYGVPSLVGLILGIIAMNQIKKTGQEGRGIALAGVIVGAVVVAGWIALLILIFGVAAFSDSPRHGSSYRGY